MLRISDTDNIYKPKGKRTDAIILSKTETPWGGLDKNINLPFYELSGQFEAKGVAESYLIPRLGMGADDDGVYIDASVDFTGIKATLVLKGDIEGKIRSKKMEKVIVEKKENMLGKKYYINK